MTKPAMTDDDLRAVSRRYVDSLLTVMARNGRGLDVAPERREALARGILDMVQQPEPPVGPDLPRVPEPPPDPPPTIPQPEPHVTAIEIDPPGAPMVYTPKGAERQASTWNPTPDASLKQLQERGKIRPTVKRKLVKKAAKKGKAKR